MAYSFTKMKYLLFSLLMMLLIVSNSRSAFAQEAEARKEMVFYAKVLSIDNNIAKCESDIFVDLSQAQARRIVEVGDLLFASGQLAPDSTHATLIKADVTNVSKQRDVQFNGSFHNVEGNTFTMLNQKITIDSNTVITNATTVANGQGGIVVTESTNTGFKAVSISVYDNPDLLDPEIDSSITEIKNNVIKFAGGFSVRATDENIDFLIRNNAGPGTEHKGLINIKTIPKTKRIKSPFVGIYDCSLAFSAKLGGIDVANRTITLLNKVIPFGANPVLLQADNTGISQVSLETLNPDDYDYAQIQFQRGTGLVADVVFLYKKQ